MANAGILEGHIVTEEQILYHHALVIEQGKITDIRPLQKFTDDLPYILPGFRDQHVHDLPGQQMVPDHAVEAVTERFSRTMKALGRHGVTGVYIATFGDTVDNLVRYCTAARQWMEHPENGKQGARLLGINVEGSFINDECRGAQPAEYCLIPTRDDCIGALDRLHETGAVRFANIVPDYGEPSLATIRHARSLGIQVGSGHLKPPADLLTHAGEEAGISYMVHFTNGPTGQSFKPFGGGGAFEGAMNIPICKELIVDRAHIDERYVLDIIHRTEERWGIEKIIAVADALFPTPDQLPEREFSIGSTLARVSDDRRVLFTVAYRQPDGSTIPAPPNQLCGSILTMDQAFSNLVSLFTSGMTGHWYDHQALPLEKAICRASQLCSGNQARLEGSFVRTGSLTTGKDADLIVGRISSQGGEYQLTIEQVWVNGSPIC